MTLSTPSLVRYLLIQPKENLKLYQEVFLAYYLIEEQLLFCSPLLTHWDRAVNISCLGCAGAGGVVMMLSRQSQWPHSPWPDMWSPAPSTERHKIDNIVYLEIKFTPLVLHHSKPNKDEIFTQDVYTSKVIEPSILTSNKMLMFLYLSIRLKGEEARLSIAGNTF